MNWLYNIPQQQAVPAVSSADLVIKRLPSWPAVSIVLLEVLAGIAPAGLLTGMNVYLLLLALVVWTASRERFDSALLRAITPFVVIIAIGLAMGAGADLYLYLKDVWYVANPAIVLSVGYVLYCCMPDVGRGLRAFVIGATLLGVVHIIRLSVQPELLMLPAVKIREHIGTGYYGPTLALTILCAYSGKWTEGLKLSLPVALSFLIVCIAAIGLSFSRTIVIVALIGVLASIGVFSRREWLRVGLVVLVALAALAILRISVGTQSHATQGEFLTKLSRSLDELHVEEYSDIRSISENWRGYETARALKHYATGSSLQWIFGFGFGSQVDLGLAMPLGATVGEGHGAYMRSIPVFHNGYIYLLMKGGVAALFLFASSIAWMYSVGRRFAAAEIPQSTRSPARVLQAITFTIVLTTWIISGVFNKADMFPYLLAGGFVLAALTRQHS